jgi:hypothetical protein
VNGYYWCYCDDMVESAVAGLDLSAPECGFPWYRLGKLVHQINNIRHVQHHAALLAGRLRLASGAMCGGWGLSERVAASVGAPWFQRMRG